MVSTQEAGGSRTGTAAWRQKADRFWRWWTRELLEMMPERFGAMAGGARLPLLRFEGGDLVRLDGRAGLGQATGRVTLEGLDPSRARAAARALLEAAGETRGRARLALQPGQSLVRRISMPAATEENLGAVLGFEMDRLTPFRAEEVYYDHRVVGRNGSAGTIEVLIAVARREIVDAQVERLRALGVSVQGVAPGDGPQGGAPMDVLPSAQRGERQSAAERTLRNGLAIAVVLLFIVALALPILRKQQAVRALTPLVDRAHAQAQATDALVQQLERLSADHNFLLAKKHGSPPALAYIEEISRLLPDNTWLQQLDLRNAGKVREVQVSGETAASSRLIEVLEQSALFRNASQRGSVTRGTQAGTERFVIAAETEGRPMPEKRKAADIAPAAPPAAAPAIRPPSSAPASQAPAAAPASQPPAAAPVAPGGAAAKGGAAPAETPRRKPATAPSSLPTVPKGPPRAPSTGAAAEPKTATVQPLPPPATPNPGGSK